MCPGAVQYQNLVTRTSDRTVLMDGDACGGGGGYLEREPRLATVGWHAGQRHSPTGMR